MFSIFSFSRKWCLKRHHVLEWNYASYHSHSLFPEYHLKHHQYLYFHCHPKILIDWERCCLHQRSTCLYDYGPGSVLSLTECTLFGLYPWLNFVILELPCLIITLNLDIVMMKSMIFLLVVFFFQICPWFIRLWLPLTLEPLTLVMPILGKINKTDFTQSKVPQNFLKKSRQFF